MWAPHCLLMDWPGQARDWARARETGPLDMPKCSSPGLLPSPPPSPPFFEAWKLPSAVKYGQVKWSWLRAQALWLCGHILPSLIFVAVSLSLSFCFFLRPFLWHCFTLFFYLCLGFTSCLLRPPTPSPSCPGLYSISSFTYCARFVFLSPFSYLASWFTFFLI